MESESRRRLIRLRLADGSFPRERVRRVWAEEAHGRRALPVPSGSHRRALS
jgi:hypothetical protein